MSIYICIHSYNLRSEPCKPRACLRPQIPYPQPRNSQALRQATFQLLSNPNPYKPYSFGKVGEH